MRTYVYIDGFNLYYGAVRGTSYKWLDLNLLCSHLFPKNNIVSIKYFTAIVSGTADDPDKPTRQNHYLHALKAHIPHFEAYYGFFLRQHKYLPLAYSQGHVKYLKTEEKGSDVNLSVHLLNDAWLDKFDAAIVVSNDSDLAEAIRLVVEERKKPVGILNPRIDGNNPFSVQLNKIASFRKRLKIKDLEVCQLPDPIPGTTLYKPDEWNLSPPLPSL